ncbi:MAG: aconitate hydratase AcnA [Acidobacteriota bacterium]|nr:aconitate hydratase AcnA [Acidobacteriota bacterium]
MSHNLYNSFQEFGPGNGRTGRFYSLPQLERRGIGSISRLPVSLRIVLESLLRNFDGNRITEQDIHALANWKATGTRTREIPFVVARIVLQDFTGVPLLVDLAAMRSAVARMGGQPKRVEPLVPVDLVVDHSIQVDYSGSPQALQLNMEMEFRRNRARYQFLKWGMQAFDQFRVIPPGVGIVHQVNLEYLAQGVVEKEGIYYPDTLVGTDSHTTMINGLGILGWGVGGIEAEAGMLGQPVYILTPDVVGVHLTGSLREGVTATDLVLKCTEMLRKAKVVGKFVEYFGEGATSLPVTDRATIANMAPEYGATIGFFPVDEETCSYLLATGRSGQQVEAFRNYYKAQGLFGIPRQRDCDYTRVLEVDLGEIRPSVAGPRRPQDRLELDQLKPKFRELLSRPLSEGGFEQEPSALKKRYPLGTPSGASVVGHGDVLIAAITSCTNTSNPGVMLAAGLLARNAVEKGLSIGPTVKRSLAPGSRVVSSYLENTGLQPYLDRLGFNLVGYGCTTCIGNSGPLDPDIERVVTGNDLVAASVLSGNRNFEARVHPNIKANFLMSPPLVVAFGLAGRIDIDLSSEPIGRGSDGEEVYLKDIWPSLQEVSDLMSAAFDPETFRRMYGDSTGSNGGWQEIPASRGDLFEWDSDSTYIQEPPFFEDFSPGAGEVGDIKGARPLAILGDSVTTDHISPAGAIAQASPAGAYLVERGVAARDFNSYGSRRGNDRVMTRGTFANVRIKNLMVPGIEGGFTRYQPDGSRMTIYEAALRYREQGTPLIVLAGQEYGTGSSRDWAAKGTRLLGVRAVVARSFERIHRSNLVGMGVLPCQFQEGTGADSLRLDGSEVFDLVGIESEIQPRQQVHLVVHRPGGQTETVPVTVRIDTPVEVEYYRHQGILPYVLSGLLTT